MQYEQGWGEVFEFMQGEPRRPKWLPKDAEASVSFCTLRDDVFRAEAEAVGVSRFSVWRHTPFNCRWLRWGVGLDFYTDRRDSGRYLSLLGRVGRRTWWVTRQIKTRL